MSFFRQHDVQDETHEYEEKDITTIGVTIVTVRLGGQCKNCSME